MVTQNDNSARRVEPVKVDLLIGDRVRIKRGQPWAEEYGTFMGMEWVLTLGKYLYKIKLDSGQNVLQTRGHFIAQPIERN